MSQVDPSRVDEPAEDPEETDADDLEAAYEALDHLAVLLFNSNRYEPALRASEEATGLYRELAGGPAGFEADLERSLLQLGRVLDALGRHEEAAAANAEANALASTRRQTM